MLGHDLLEERDPVHAGHLDVQGNHVWGLLFHLVRCHVRIGSGGHDLYFGIRSKDVG